MGNEINKRGSDMKKIVLILCFISGLAGCVTTQQDRAAMRGGAVGATAGAVIGSSTGDTGKGAVIGGMLGAAAGVLLQQNQRQATPQPRQAAPSRQYIEHRSNQRYDRQESDDGEQGYRRSEHEDD